MTKVYYKCRDKEGTEFIVLTWPEAKRVEEGGGTYKIVYDSKTEDEDNSNRS